MFLSSQSDRWFSPSLLVESARKVLSVIDLDPFSEAMANLVVRATVYYCRRRNGWQQTWKVRVFMNPPGNVIEGKSANGLAFSKLLSEFNAGGVSAFICILTYCLAPPLIWELERELLDVAQIYGLDALLQQRKLDHGLGDTSVADGTPEHEAYRPDTCIHLPEEDVLL
eukprot:gene18719-22353_t